MHGCYSIRWVDKKVSGTPGWTALSFLTVDSVWPKCFKLPLWFLHRDAEPLNCETKINPPLLHLHLPRFITKQQDKSLLKCHWRVFAAGDTSHTQKNPEEETRAKKEHPSFCAVLPTCRTSCQMAEEKHLLIPFLCDSDPELSDGERWVRQHAINPQRSRECLKINQSRP